MEINIKFNKEEYKDLFKLAFLGNWVINSHKESSEDSFEKLLLKIASHAKDFGLEKQICIDEDDSSCYPAENSEFQLDDFILDYNENNFWNELVHKLASKDMYNKYGEAIESMTPEEYLEKSFTFEKKHTEEIEKNGLDNLTLSK